MPQFQIRQHPHGGTWQLFLLGRGHRDSIPYMEGNSVQECVNACEHYVIVSSFRWRFQLEVLSD